MEAINPQDYVYGLIYKLEESVSKDIIDTYLRKYLDFNLYTKLEWDLGNDEDNNRIYLYFDESVFNDNEMQQLFEVFTEFDGSCDYEIVATIFGQYMKIPDYLIEVTYYGWGDGKGQLYVEVADSQSVMYNKLHPWGFDDAI